MCKIYRNLCSILVLFDTERVCIVVLYRLFTGYRTIQSTFNIMRCLALVPRCTLLEQCGQLLISTVSFVLY